MKALSILITLLTTSAFAQGTDPRGTGDMAPDPYPNSGQTDARSSNIMGNESSSMEETSSAAQAGPTQGSGEVNQREQVPLDMKEGYVDQVADRSTEDSFEAALSQGKTQTGPYKTTGNPQAAQEEPEGNEVGE